VSCLFHHWRAGSAVQKYSIGHSLRFRSGASPSLNRTFGTSTLLTKQTFSWWAKRGDLATMQNILANVQSNQTYFTIGFGFASTNVVQLEVIQAVANIVSFNKRTSAVLRDPLAHYHFHVTIDTTQATAADRIKITINGVLQTAFATNVDPALNATSGWGVSGQSHRISSGLPTFNSYFFDGYLSEVNFIDGQAVVATEFGEFGVDGVWVPKAYVGTYGAQGFYLPFNNGSNLANLTADASGNGNNWTANNISLTAGATYDWVQDTPTNNCATLNPLDILLSNFNSYFADANLRFGSSNRNDGYAGVRASVAVESGKWYWEGVVTGNSGVTIANAFGVDVPNTPNSTIGAVGSGGTATSWAYVQTGQKRTGGVGAAYGAAFAVGDVIGIALDADTPSITFYKNGVSQGVAFSGIVGPFAPSLAVYTDAGALTGEVVINLGQRPFAYTPPTGFKALCTANLPAATVTNPAGHFDIALDTGANIKAATEALFPGNYLEWIKDRANSNNHQLIDIVRGALTLHSNDTTAESAYVAPAGNSVGWAWKANGAPVANNAGTIPSQVSANITAGFSVVTYTGTGANATVGHGLGVVPKMVIVKARNAGTGWPVYHANQNAAPASGYLSLNLADAFIAGAAVWNSTPPTASVFSLGTSGGANAVGGQFVAYCFAEIPGYSKFGSYVGNGSTDGPFVWCGFRPKYVLMKGATSVTQWYVLDSARETYNVMGAPLMPNLALAESYSASENTDITANGFKIRTLHTDHNASTQTYIFAAFAEYPFGGSNISPSPAR
jgi:hypothetical protein